MVLCLIAAIASAIFETSEAVHRNFLRKDCEENLKKMYLNLTDENGNARNALLVLVIRHLASVELPVAVRR